MTTVQKIIKYLAIAFAIFLSLTIISAIISGIYIAVNAIGLVTDRDTPALTQNLEVIESNINERSSDISAIDIQILATNLQIKTGDSFKIETNNSEIKCKEENGKITIIEDEKYNWWFIGEEKDSRLVIYLPENEKEYDNIRIKNGAGKITVEKLVTKRFELKQGAGEVFIKNLVVSNNAIFKGGAGEVRIESGRINNLEAKQGVGNTYIKAELYGNTNIKTGIGALGLDLNLPKDEYRFDVKKGIGEVTLDGMQIGSDSIYGDGYNKIEIKGGIGNIDIRTNQN